ncbi:MAG: tetratricopeptide repeat protein [Thermostichales cyanobacterium BF3_bins_165]
MASQDPQLQTALKLWQQGNLPQALQILEDLGQRDPNSQVGVQAQMYLLRGYLQTGQLPAARRVFQGLQGYGQAYPQVQRWLAEMAKQYGALLQGGQDQRVPLSRLVAPAVTTAGLLVVTQGLILYGFWNLLGLGGWRGLAGTGLGTLILSGLPLWAGPRLLDAWVKRLGGRWLTGSEIQRLGLQEQVALIPGGTVWRYGWGGKTRLILGTALGHSLSEEERSALLRWDQGDPALAVLTWGSFWGYALAWLTGKRAIWLVQGLLYPLFWLARQRVRFWDHRRSPNWQVAVTKQARCPTTIPIPIGLFTGSDPEDWPLLRDPQFLSWEQASPWGKGVALNRPQPLWSQRLTGIPKVSARVGGLGLGLGIYFSDLILAGVGWGVGAWLFWQRQISPWDWLGMSGLGAGMGMLFKAWRMFPHQGRQICQVKQLYQNLQAQPVIGIPVQVRGLLVQDGAGWWLEDETGRIRLRWLGTITAPSGSPVSVRGWLRRGGWVWIDGESWSSGKAQGRAWPRLPLLLGAGLGIVAGVAGLMF